MHKIFFKEKEESFQTEIKNIGTYVDYGVFNRSSKIYVDVLTFCRKYGIINNNLDDTEFLSGLSKRPLGNSIVAKKALFWLYKQPVNRKKLTVYVESMQIAKTLHSLRRDGWIMGKTGKDYVVNNGKDRIIIGWKDPKLDRITTYNKLTSKQRQSLLKNRRDPYTNTRVNLQVDHRTPVEASIRYGKEAAILCTDLVNSGKAEKFFQYIEASTNSTKREACAKCLSGEVIPLPKFVKKLGYKERWNEYNENNKTCAGCFWYDNMLTEKDYVKSLNCKTTSEIF